MRCFDTDAVSILLIIYLPSPMCYYRYDYCSTAAFVYQESLIPAYLFRGKSGLKNVERWASGRPSTNYLYSLLLSDEPDGEPLME
jgi:hypothetical protein